MKKENQSFELNHMILRSKRRINTTPYFKIRVKKKTKKLNFLNILLFILSALFIYQMVSNINIFLF